MHKQFDKKNTTFVKDIHIHTLTGIEDTFKELVSCGFLIEFKQIYSSQPYGEIFVLGLNDAKEPQYILSLYALKEE